MIKRMKGNKYTEYRITNTRTFDLRTIEQTAMSARGLLQIYATLSMAMQRRKFIRQID
jgi:hypothetical protein